MTQGGSIRGESSGKAETRHKAANICAHDPRILTAVSLQVSYLQTPEICVLTQRNCCREFRVLWRSTAVKKPNNGNGCVQTQTLRLVAEELSGVLPPRKPWERRGPHQYRHGPYTQVNPASRKSSLSKILQIYEHVPRTQIMVRASKIRHSDVVSGCENIAADLQAIREDVR